MKSRGIIIKASYLTGFLTTIAGALFKINHYGGGNTIISIGLLISIVFIYNSIYEINISTRIDKTEKIIWTIGITFIAFIAGFIYILVGRKRIADFKILE